MRNCIKRMVIPEWLFPDLLLILTAIFACSTTFAQVRTSEAVIRSVADNVIRKTTFRFIDTKTKTTYASPAEAPRLTDLKAETQYNRWEYANGVLHMGMMRMADVIKDTTYRSYAIHNFDFIFQHLNDFRKEYETNPKAEYAAYFRLAALDDCGAMAAALSDVNTVVHNKEYTAYLERAADYVLNKQLRLKDGTLSRPVPRNMTIWADDLYMSVPFLARMGKATGKSSYFTEAIRQVKLFNKYLFDPTTGLYFHCWYSDITSNGVARWLRCNGWIAMAQVELLSNLPANHPERNELIALLQRQITGFSRYQDTTGLWHQLIDKPDSYIETSGTAMFTYTVAKAVNEGWINSSYLRIATDGWKGLTSMITEDGQVKDVCVGTGIQDNLNFYYTRPRVLNEFHALGAVLMAGTEMIRVANNAKK